MCFLCAVHQFEAISKLVVQAVRAVTDHIEPAAASGSIRGKGCEDDMSTCSNCISHRLHITLTVSGLRQEVKDSPVMPDVIGLMGQRCLRNIGFDPVHMGSIRAQPLAGKRKRRP